MAIFRSQCKKNSYTLTPEAEEEAKKLEESELIERSANALITRFPNPIGMVPPPRTKSWPSWHKPSTSTPSLETCTAILVMSLGPATCRSVSS